MTAFIHQELTGVCVERVSPRGASLNRALQIVLVGEWEHRLCAERAVPALETT